MTYYYEYIALGALLMVLGLLSLLRDKKKSGRCSQSVLAVVSGVEQQKSTRFDKTDPKLRNIYFPTYSYIVDGKTYTHKVEFPHKHNQEPKLGSSVEVWYDPDNPSQILTDIEARSSRKRSIIILSIGAAFCIAALSLLLSGR